jgi:tetratricopeptide (TPR) repeat protein
MTTQELYCDNCGAANPSSARFCQFCATLLPFKHSTGDLPDQTLLAGRYQLLKRIGQGGMGAVYKAADTRFNNRPVAIKEMSSSGLTPARIQEAEEAFEHEAHLLADLLHPNLPRIYEHFTENDRSYLVMDFIEGLTLEEYLEQKGGGPLPVDQVITWAEQLCDVLNYLHSHQPPIIFRDLKPANVMISDSGHVYLIDFGIARFFKPGKQHDTVALGSPGYAAPEQYGKAQSTPRSDIYSLGALLHHLLTGVDPSNQPFFFQDASQLNPAINPAFDILLKQMLAMDSDRRPASAQEVLNALKGAATNQSRSASRPLGYTQDPMLDQAYKFYTQKRLDEAIALYDKALKTNTTDPLGWQGYGLSQRLKGLNQDALSSFEHALQIDPGLVTSWNGKGTVLGKLRRHQEALDAFEHALQLEPKNAAAWNGKGAALHALGRSNQALDAFDKALLYDPLLVQAWYNKGLLLHDMGRYRDAEMAFQEAINLDNRHAQAYFGRGQSLYALQRLKKALQMFDLAVQKEPLYVEAWNRRGNVLDEMSDITRALQSYERALQIDPHYAPAWSGKGGVLRQLGQYYDALKAYNFALDIDPNFALAWNGKGNTLYNLRSYHEALAAYEQALKLNPRLRTAWHNKSLVLNQLGRYEEALNAANEAIHLRPDDPDNWLRKAESLKKLRRRDEARSAEIQAAKLRGNA